MTSFLIQQSAALRIDEIYRFSRGQWGDAKAQVYIEGLFDAFGIIAAGAIASRPIPAEFGVQGFCCRYERHVIYWKRLPNGSVGIVTVLHERMHQIGRFRDDFGI